MAMLIWFLQIFFIFLGVGDASNASILLSLKNSVDDPLQSLQSWSSNSSICKWKGVTCSFDKAHVVSLRIQSLVFKSPSNFSSTIEQLNELQVLDISGNHFFGSVYFSGKNKIKRLILASNNFTSVAIHSCQNLIQLDIISNIVTEQFFQVPRCLNLKILNIASNNFSGEFPVSLASSPSLESVDASYNNFNGEVPMFQSEHLLHLNLSSNSFNSVADDFCASSPELSTLLLVNNMIREVLGKVMNCARLSMLDVSFNNLDEEIPNNICTNVPRLSHLMAWANNLHGEIPQNFAACANLTIIFLNHNSLTGSIPSKLVQMQTLKWLSLGHNKLTGTIPEVHPNMETLQLSSNFLEGPLPEQLAIYVELQNNKLTGAIPSNWGFAEPKFYSDEYLITLRKVCLQDGIEAQEVCVERFMAIQGITVDTATNLLASRTGCKKVDVRLLPTQSASTTRSPYLIDIRYNRIAGSIPEDIGNMQELLYVNFAHNLLTGHIPESFGKMNKLLRLNISHNSLSGSIPSSFSQLTLLTSLDISYNDFSGPIPQSGQLSTLEAQDFEGNPGLCGLPLPTKCSFTPVYANPRSGRDNKDADAYIVALAFGIVSFFTTLTFFTRNCHIMGKLF